MFISHPVQTTDQITRYRFCDTLVTDAIESPESNAELQSAGQRLPTGQRPRSERPEAKAETDAFFSVAVDHARMSHECEDCGESFETLTRLRVHDCGDDGTDDAGTDDAGTDADSPPRGSDTSTATSATGESDTSTAVPDLDDRLEQVSAGESDAIYGAVATFESTLSTTLDEGGGDAYRDVFWRYYEQVGDALDAVARSEGWAPLGDVVAAYDPAAGDAIPLATSAIANAVGRHVIRTRLTDGVAAVPVDALEYLDAVAVNAGDADDVAREEVHAYGWGIGHPDHAVVDRLRDRASEDIFSVNASLEHAFYADQHAAVDALERLVRDESIDGTLSRFRREDRSYGRYLLDCVYGLKTDDYWPTTPRYWDWHDEFDVADTFELDEAVERRIRELVAEMGFDADLPDDWTLRDLGV